MALKRVLEKIKKSLDWGLRHHKSDPLLALERVGFKINHVWIPYPRHQLVGPLIGPTERLGQNQAKFLFLVCDINKLDNLLALSIAGAKIKPGPNF